MVNKDEEGANYVQFWVLNNEFREKLNYYLPAQLGSRIERAARC